MNDRRVRPFDPVPVPDGLRRRQRSAHHADSQTGSPWRSFSASPCWPRAAYDGRRNRLALRGSLSVVLTATFTLFALNVIESGDAKLAAATALWLGFDGLLDYLLAASVLGGILTLRSSPRGPTRYRGASRRCPSRCTCTTARPAFPTESRWPRAALLVLPETSLWSRRGPSPRADRSPASAQDLGAAATAPLHCAHATRIPATSRSRPYRRFTTTARCSGWRCAAEVPRDGSRCVSRRRPGRP